jgi:hypothetical protein
MSAPCVIRRACRLAWAAVFVAMTIAAPVAQAAERKVVALPLVNGALRDAPDTVRLKQGDDVELRWTSDRPIKLHLHGYDIEREVVPGKTASMAFKASLPGRFPVEVHGGGKGAHRPVLYLEVYP